jgi:phage FluMu gp28-like protein
VEKIGAFLDQVPRWFWGSDYYSPDPDSPKNKKSIYKARNKQRIELFNGCRIYARSSGENAARGISAVSILIFDEAAFIQNGLSVYAQAVAATASVRDAKILMISTPNGKDQLYYRTYSKAIKKENNYHSVEFKWFQDLRYNRNLKWYRRNKDNGQIEWFYEKTLDKEGNIAVTTDFVEDSYKKFIYDSNLEFISDLLKNDVAIDLHALEGHTELYRSVYGIFDNIPEYKEKLLALEHTGMPRPEAQKELVSDFASTWFT